MSRQPTTISLFSGAGGLDLGFEAAGYRTGVLVELNSHCCDTIRANRRWAVVEKSVFDVPTADMLEAARRKCGEVDVVIGGPPCQPFSKAGQWATGKTRGLEDPRARTLEAYFRVVREALPRAFVLENVEGLAAAGGVDRILDLVSVVNAKTGANYCASVGVLSAVDFGVPQRRVRLFVVGARDGATFTFPSPTHGVGLGLEPWRTAWDALGDLPAEPHDAPPTAGKWSDLLPSIPEGENYLWHTERGGGMRLFGWRTRYWSFLLKLAKNQPAWTISATPGPSTGPFHWANRRLSPRELLRLQTFPDDFVVTGGYREVHRQVGNAVPPLLGEIVAREVRWQLLGGRRSAARPSLLGNRHASVPAAESLGSVPEHHARRAGIHAPHPGPGKGPRALLPGDRVTSQGRGAGRGSSDAA